MSNQQSPLTKRLDLRSLYRAVVTLTLLSALSLCVRSAAAAQYVYSGRDASYSNILMEVYITPTPAGADVTGTVKCGNVLMLLRGALLGSILSANITYQQTAGVAAVAGVVGSLNGTLGTGILNVATGAVDINGRTVTMSFSLVPANPNPAVYPGSPAPYTPPSPALPSALHLTGGTSFGYSRVALNLDLTLKGSSAYLISGTINVNQLVLKRFSPPRTVQATLRVSGLLTPGGTGALDVIGTPSGSFPHFVGRLSSSGAQFQGFLSGIPSLGITGLPLVAHQ